LLFNSNLLFKGKNAPVVEVAASASAKTSTMTLGESDIKSKIEEQGVKVRQLKESKAAKDAIDGAVKALLELKAQYKSETGQDYVPPGGNQRSSGKKEPGKKEEKPKVASAPKDSGDGKKQSKLGLDCKKSENLSDWFSQVGLYSSGFFFKIIANIRFCYFF
jgi:bifunctional glutamyl/prolyl-tRNA synthetase